MSDPGLALRLDQFHQFVEELGKLAPAEVGLDLPKWVSRGVVAAGSDANEALMIGETYSFSGTASRAGWLHLINLGTDGMVAIIITGGGPGARLEKGARFAVPSDRYLTHEKVIRVGEPATKLPHQLDTLLVVITDQEVTLSMADLPAYFLRYKPDEAEHSRGGGGAPPPARGSFAGDAEPELPRLQRLIRSGKAGYGLLRFQILER